MSTTAAPSIGRLLLPFCAADRREVPGLAFPVYVAGAAGKVLTFASDGKTCAIWTAGRVGRYRDWSGTGSPDGFSPVAWRNRYRSGASTPLPTGTTIRRPILWLGRTGYLPAPFAKALDAFDAVWLAGSEEQAGGWQVLSFVATLEKRAFHGVILA